MRLCSFPCAAAIAHPMAFRRVELTPLPGIWCTTSLFCGPFGHLVCNSVVFGSTPHIAIFFARLRRAAPPLHAPFTHPTHPSPGILKHTISHIARIDFVQAVDGRSCPGLRLARATLRNQQGATFASWAPRTAGIEECASWAPRTAGIEECSPPASQRALRRAPSALPAWARISLYMMYSHARTNNVTARRPFEEAALTRYPIC
jgi:hypothetical protein